MEIYSTWYSDEKDIKGWAFDALALEVKKSQEITIVSAYYSTIFLRRILEKVNKSKRGRCTVRLIFNGFSGQRLNEQIKDLQELKVYLKEKQFKKVDIFLYRNATLFHTKLYLIKNNKRTVWFAGSANASQAAFERNEEILIKNTTRAKSIFKYTEYIIEDAIKIENIDLENIVESNIIGFFRTGSIYFKPNNQISFTFSQFKLPEGIENIIATTGERPRNTNPGKAWGAYNLKMSLGVDSSQEEKKKSQTSLKPFSIETCYGYWVPNIYRQDVDKKIRKKSKSRKKNYKNILKRINKKGVETLVKDYNNYLSDIENILEKQEISFPIDTVELNDKFRKFVKHIISKLSNKKKLKKLCLPLVATGMPEIWEDDVAYEDFTESFYEYISNYTTGQKPRIIKSILEQLDIAENSDSEEIEEAFDKHFKEGYGEWKDDYWN